MKVLLCISFAIALNGVADAAKLSKPVALSVIGGDLLSLQEDCIKGDIKGHISLIYDNSIRFDVKLEKKGVLSIDGDVTVAMSRDDPAVYTEEQAKGPLHYNCTSVQFYNSDDFVVKQYRYVTKYDRPSSKARKTEDVKRRMEYIPADDFNREIMAIARRQKGQHRGQDAATHTHTLNNGKKIRMLYNPAGEFASVLGDVHVVALLHERLDHSTTYVTVQYSLTRNSGNQIHKDLHAYAVRPQYDPKIQSD